MTQRGEHHSAGSKARKAEPDASGQTPLSILLIGSDSRAFAANVEERTVVRCPSVELRGDAQRVAESVGIPMSSVRRSIDVSGVTVVVGADRREGTACPEQDPPGAGGLPEALVSGIR